jgi:hypothetical protein
MAARATIPAVTENVELHRLGEDAVRKVNWKRWGPYLSERQWATVREDYSPGGDSWGYFPHKDARSRAYRWGEDGLFGWTDRQCRLCFGLALWNHQDPFLKERLYGLTSGQGNHGEDVKESYFYLDSTPTHSYCRASYHYPQARFPYEQLIEENRRRTRLDPEFEIEDTGVFKEGRYFEVVTEYAKASANDMLIRVTVHNHGPEEAPLDILPTLWFRNTWSWPCPYTGVMHKPELLQFRDDAVIAVHQPDAIEPDAMLGRFVLQYGKGQDGKQPELMVCENETNTEKLYKVPNTWPYVKDAIHRAVVDGDRTALNPQQIGTKCGLHYRFRIPPGGKISLSLRLTDETELSDGPLGPAFPKMIDLRRREADVFYGSLASRENLDSEELCAARQASAGLFWSKQFYHYVVRDWLKGDPGQPAPPASRKLGRNHDWKHVFARDVLSMPDKWEYPWFAAWDLAFHTVAYARVDPHFAKNQITLLLREWYMHPNGQLPAYEYNFSDVNPPVHAWAAWRVYKITDARGHRDRDFLESVFQKLLINFTWWVNRKDNEGRNLFSGGFLGLDNISVFDRSKPLPTGGYLQQADGTAWMAFYALHMLIMALELAYDGKKVHEAYADMASKFFEHFVEIVDAMNSLGGSGLFDDEDGFYYDQIRHEGQNQKLKIRSMVGLIPLLAVEVLDQNVIDRLPGFKRRLDWFLAHRSDLASYISYCKSPSHATEKHDRRLLAVPSKKRLERVLKYVFSSEEFLSPFGLRSLSKIHEKNPFVYKVNGDEYRVAYEPGESSSGLYGGNSNWRGPIWFPINYLLIEALERYHHFYGDSIQIELPAGSGNMVSLKEAADEISGRLASIFLFNKDGNRPAMGSDPRFAKGGIHQDNVLFHEYFHAETGRGLGASHQTGWTALVIRSLIDTANCRHGC